ALVTAYETTTADLSAVGGLRKGRVWVGHAQEIDLATGKLLFDWSSIDHVPVQESYQPLVHPKGTFDYFHIDSVAETDDGNLLISARNTWTLYKVDRSNGHVLWRMNGKKSDFTLGSGAAFHWQHCAGAHGPDILTVFDNGVRQEKQSRALVLTLDTNAMHVDLTHAYAHPSG